MQMIRFGMALDGGRGWQLGRSAGVPVYGPGSLLLELERRLGLAVRPVQRASRVLQMRGCLADEMNGQRFFERSFLLDEIGTAATLLGWRDDWHLHGWVGSFAATASSRLRDMGCVEALAQDRVAANVGQRLVQVAVALSDARLPCFSIELTEPLDQLPACWRHVFSYLPTQDALPLGALAQPGSDLFHLQTSLLNTHQNGRICAAPVQRDGSVRWVRASTVLAASHWLAGQAGGQRVVVAEHPVELLESVLESAGRPQLGLGSGSGLGLQRVCRPTLQLLGLALRLLRAPLDFTNLKLFLTHSVNPLPAASCHRLMERLATTPGVGGGDWDALLLSLADTSVPGHQLRRAELGYWLEHQRYPREPGIPIDVLIERTERIAGLLSSAGPQASANGLPGNVFRAGTEAAVEFAAALSLFKAQGRAHLGMAMLDKLLELALGDGSLNRQRWAQCVAQDAAVTSGAALIEPFAEVLWWQLQPSPLGARRMHLPWSKSEVLALAAAGALLPDAVQVAQAAAVTALRPILLAQHCLTLVLPAPGQELHPVWWLVKAALPDLPVCAVEDMLINNNNNNNNTGVAAGLHLQPIIHQALPALRRWWQMPADMAIKSAQAYSFSSLERLVFNPHQWVLAHPAQLQAAALLRFPNEFTLTANLAHRLVERLYRKQGCLAWQVAEVSSWIEQEFLPLLQQEGAPLLMPGRKAELLLFKSQLSASMTHLHSLLQQAGVVAVQPEVRLSGLGGGFELRGLADLLLLLPDGQQVVVDMKWAGTDKYRRKLVDGTHLQLAIYAQLVKQLCGVCPEVAYYLLRPAELLTPAQGIFKNVRPAGVMPGSTAATWQKLLVSWSWRSAQLKAGRIEVVLEQTEPTEASEPPEAGLRPELLNSRYNPFINLAGWRVGA